MPGDRAALFVFDEPLLRDHVFGAACVGFMLGCLEDVRRSLAERGVTLLWRTGEPVETVLRTAQDLAVDAVYWNRDYEPGAIDRDRIASSAWLDRVVRSRPLGPCGV